MIFKFEGHAHRSMWEVLRTKHTKQFWSPNQTGYGQWSTTLYIKDNRSQFVMHILCTWCVCWQNIDRLVSKCTAEFTHRNISKDIHHKHKLWLTNLLIVSRHYLKMFIQQGVVRTLSCGCRLTLFDGIIQIFIPFKAIKIYIIK